MNKSLQIAMKGVISRITLGGEQEMIAINEDGLYEVCMTVRNNEIGKGERKRRSTQRASTKED